MEAEILSSITSASMEKVTLVYLCLAWGFSWRDINWETLNGPLCQLADQSGCTRKLEVDFRIMCAGVVEVDGGAGLVTIADSLARFREKGKIRVAWVGPDGRENVVYPRPG